MSNDKNVKTNPEHVSSITERVMAEIKANYEEAKSVEAQKEETGKTVMSKINATKITMVMALILQACSGETGPAAARSLEAGAPVLVQPAPSPSPSATPSVTPSPSPSPSPSAAPYAYSGGTGVHGDPFILSVPEDVQRIGENPSAEFSMNQSINMGGADFTPIQSFSGVLYGNGFDLSNLTIVNHSSSVSVAMFINMSGTVTNVKFVSVSIYSEGYAAVVASSLTGRISFCEFTGGLTSMLGGNGFSSGVGRTAYVTKTGATLLSNTQTSFGFNGTSLNGAVL